jgi:hypothetical protein
MLHFTHPKEEERPSFLKKRSKRLLLSGHGPDAWRPWPENKSFFGSFFAKKELLS